MSILSRIEVAIGVISGNRQFRKELRAYNRAAGAKNNNEAKQPSVNSTNIDQSNNTEPYEETNQNDKDHAIVEKNPEIKKEEQSNNTEVKSSTEEKKPKTEQQINAEAEAPIEQAGAEQIKAEGVVQELPIANMNTPVHIAEPTPGVLNMDGVCINTKDVMQPVNHQSAIQQQTQHTVQPMFNPIVIPSNDIPAPTQANPINPAFTAAGNPMMPGGFNLNPIPGMDTYNQHLSNIHPQAGVGHHKIDNPQPAKPPKPPKASQDKVDMTGMPNLMNGMEVQKFESFDARTHGILEENVSKEVEKVPLKSVFPTNADLYKDHPYLAEVEQVALDNGYQIGFAVRPNGLIDCNIANAEGQYINTKGFMIDPGLIIDRRKKVFPGLKAFYEGENAYPLFINSNTKDKDGGKKDKKSANVFNEELIKTLIVGGNEAITAKGMYTEDFRNLNAIVALITIPTDKNGPADRKYIQNRLIDIYKSGVFNEALAINPNARFRIMDYNSSTGTIILDSSGVFKNFGGQYFDGEHIQFKITKDKCKMLRGENIIDPVVKK